MTQNVSDQKYLLQTVAAVAVAVAEVVKILPQNLCFSVTAVPGVVIAAIVAVMANGIYERN